MLVGSGLLSSVFNEYASDENVVIFASGVSNSSQTDENEFLREQELVEKTIDENLEKKFIYFSSCALVDDTNYETPYYLHKKRMEVIIQSLAPSYLIIRLPQVFGEIKEHVTLINFLCMKVLKGEMFEVWAGASRYVIHIDDVLILVRSFIENKLEHKIINVANTYRYTLFELIEYIEKKVDRKARFIVLDKQDSYELEFRFLQDYIKKNNLKFSFGKSYFFEKLKVH